MKKKIDLKIVNFELAKVLRGIGFPQRNRDYDKWYDQSGNLENYTNLIAPFCYAPAIVQVEKWFAEEKNIHLIIQPSFNWQVVKYSIDGIMYPYNEEMDVTVTKDGTKFFPCREDAVEFAIEEIIRERLWERS